MDSIPCCVSEVDLHFLYYVSAFVCTVSVSGVCVCGGGGGGGGVHVCTQCVCRVYVCSECIYAVRSCCVFLV